MPPSPPPRARCSGRSAPRSASPCCASTRSRRSRRSIARTGPARAGHAARAPKRPPRCCRQKRDAIDNAIGAGSTFDEIVADQKLTAANTVPLTAAGLNPDDLARKADPAFAQALLAAFAAEQGDDPQLVPVGQDGSFSHRSRWRRIIPVRAAPARPDPREGRQRLRDRPGPASSRARRRSMSPAQVNKGMPLAPGDERETKLGIPGPQTVPPISRGQIENAARGQIPPAITLMFSMTEKKARMLEAPNKGGWFVVYLNHIERGNAAGQKPVIDRARAQIGQVIGREYIQQFTEAVRRSVGVKKNDKAIGVVRAALTGQGGSINPGASGMTEAAVSALAAGRPALVLAPPDRRYRDPGRGGAQADRARPRRFPARIGRRRRDARAAQPDRPRPRSGVPRRRRRGRRSTAHWLTDKAAFDAVRGADARGAPRARRHLPHGCAGRVAPGARLPGRLFRL